MKTDEQEALFSRETLLAITTLPFQLEMSSTQRVLGIRLNEASETTGSRMFKQSIADLLDLDQTSSLDPKREVKVNSITNSPIPIDLLISPFA